MKYYLNGITVDEINKMVNDKVIGRTQDCDSDIVQGGWDFLKDKLKYPKSYEP